MKNVMQSHLKRSIQKSCHFYFLLQAITTTIEADEAIDKIVLIFIQISHNLKEMNSFLFFDQQHGRGRRE